MSRYYNHVPREAPHEPGDDPNVRECVICGDPITGLGEGLMHVGETIPTTPIPAEYRGAMRDCAGIVETALSRVPDRATDAERARAVIAALIRERYLRARRAPAKAA